MKQILILTTILLSLTACENALFQKEQATIDPLENFDYFWNQINEKYAYFELKKVDWDAVRLQYEPLVFEGMSDDSLFQVMADMMAELEDGHNNLISSFNRSYSWVIYNGQDQYDRRIIYENYLSDSEYLTGPFRHSFLENEEIGYIRFDEFTGTVDHYSLDFMLDRFASTKGLILDIRENHGGSPDDIFMILSRFIEEETLLNYSRNKLSSKDHDLFAEPSPAYLQPSDHTRYTNKLMVLIDGETYSAGSFFSLATKALDHVVLIGDTTGGGLGLPNGGQLPNGWTYRCSTTQALNLSKEADWEKGVPADINIDFDWNNRSKDEILERAIEEILK